MLSSSQHFLVVSNYCPVSSSSRILSIRAKLETLPIGLESLFPLIAEFDRVRSITLQLRCESYISMYILLKIEVCEQNRNLYEHRFRASVYSNSGSTSDSTSVHFKTRTSVLTTSEPLVAGSISSEVTYDALPSEKGVLYHSELMLPYSENTSKLLGLRMVNMCACMCAAYITYSIEV